jgi:serine/threonine protein kinase
MEESQTCPDCGSPLVPGKPCAACLLGVGLESLSQEPGSRLQWNPPTVDELAGRFPELEILKFIGRGGMGAVYQARQKSLNRLVALKILPPEIGHQSAFTERFAREAQAMARLNHPNIVTIYEFGERQGLFFFMMEFVDGVTLRHLLGGERISPREALAIVPQICDALQYAHDQGIVHRDIKPENILLDRQGRVKVADFGLAKLMAAAEGEAPAQSPATDAAATVAAVGTPSYMAPEQSEQPGKVDHRADIYALGVVFYQMLTGELPGHQQIVPPSQRVQIDVRLDQVVLRALERKPELRYNQVSEVKTLVETIAQGQVHREGDSPKEDLLWRRFIRVLLWSGIPLLFCIAGEWAESGNLKCDNSVQMIFQLLGFFITFFACCWLADTVVSIKRLLGWTALVSAVGILVTSLVGLSTIDNYHMTWKSIGWASLIPWIVIFEIICCVQLPIYLLARRRRRKVKGSSSRRSAKRFILVSVCIFLTCGIVGVIGLTIQREMHRKSTQPLSSPPVPVLSNSTHPQIPKYPINDKNLSTPRKVMEAFLWCSLAGDVDGLAELFWVPDEASRQELKAWLRKTENLYRIECLQDIHWMLTGEAIFVYQSGNKVYKLQFTEKNGRCYILDAKLPGLAGVTLPSGCPIPEYLTRTAGENESRQNNDSDGNPRRLSPEELIAPVSQAIVPLPYSSSDFHLVELAQDASPVRKASAKPWLGAWAAKLPDGNQAYCHFYGLGRTHIGVLSADETFTKAKNPLGGLNFYRKDYPDRWLLLPTSDPNQWFAYNSGGIISYYAAVFYEDKSRRPAYYKPLVFCNQVRIAGNALEWESNHDSKPLVFARLSDSDNGATMMYYQSVRWIGWFCQQSGNPMPIVYQFFRDGTGKAFGLADTGIFRGEFEYELRNGWLHLGPARECPSNLLAGMENCVFRENKSANGMATLHRLEDEGQTPGVSNKIDLLKLPEDCDSGPAYWSSGGFSRNGPVWETKIGTIAINGTYSLRIEKKKEQTPYTWEILYRRCENAAIPEWGDVKISLAINGKPMKMPSEDGKWYAPANPNPYEKRRICLAANWNPMEDYDGIFNPFAIAALLKGIQLPEDLDPLRDKLTFRLSCQAPRQINPIPKEPYDGRYKTDWTPLSLPLRTPAEMKAFAEKTKASKEKLRKMNVIIDRQEPITK